MRKHSDLTAARSFSVLAVLAAVGIGASLWGVFQLKRAIVDAQELYLVDTIGTQRESNLEYQTQESRHALLSAQALTDQTEQLPYLEAARQTDAKIRIAVRQFQEAPAPAAVALAAASFEKHWIAYIQATAAPGLPNERESFLAAIHELRSLRNALEDHAKLQSVQMDRTLKSCIWGLAFFVAVTSITMAGLIRLNRRHGEVARSLIGVNQELERARELDHRRVKILEMVSAHAPLSTSLAAIAELAGSAHPGAGAAIWSVTGEALLYQVSSGLPGGFKNLVRSQSCERSGRWLAQGLAAPAREAGLRCIPADLTNAAGDPIGLLMVFIPQSALSAEDTSTGVCSTMAQLASLAIENGLLYERLAFQAQHDVLTGLPNRLLFQDRVQQSIRLAHRNSDTLAVLWVDVDRLKHINDTFGHRVGDELLCEVARRVQRSIRDSDTAARLGGDEFVVLANDLAGGGDAALVAQKIMEAMREPFAISGQEIKTSVSIGISLYPEHGTEPAALMRHADLAMYKAKRAGRDAHQMFLPQFGHSLGRHLEIERELNNALNGNEFHLEYQPLIGRHNQVESLEALLRWDNGALGSVSPGEFIPIAEEAGLICGVGRWVAREACRQGAEWLRSGMELPRIAINASGIQFADRGFAQMIHAALEEFGLPPAKLEIEVTETALVDNLDCALEQILDLRELGIQFAIDDFGTGYSSLNQLRTLPVDCVKIDRSFIKDLRETSRDTTTLVRGIIGLAHSLQLRVVAEGVETEQQLSLLRSLGCDTIQGFFLHRPLTVSAVEDLMRDRTGRAAEEMELSLV